MEIFFPQMVTFLHKGKREAILASCDLALKNLDTTYIDIFYMHRMDVNTPIEETISAFKVLI
jgi:aryl-alcohol dehydrogenase-like predicted oxidoreductase